MSKGVTKVGAAIAAFAEKEIGFYPNAGFFLRGQNTKVTEVEKWCKANIKGRSGVIKLAWPAILFEYEEDAVHAFLMWGNAE